jgi:hypothetical protein
MALILFSLGFVPTGIRVAKADAGLGNEAGHFCAMNGVAVGLP